MFARLGEVAGAKAVAKRQHNPGWRNATASGITNRSLPRFASLIAASTFVIKPFCVLIGRDYELFAFNYFVDFFSYGKTHSCNYLKYPHALDAHSSFHVLHEIEHKTLIIAGMLDVLTPAYHSYEMRARMPNSELLVKTFGTHFTCLEYPEEIGERLVKFLKHKSIDKGKKRGKSRSKSRGRGRKGKDTKKRN